MTKGNIDSFFTSKKRLKAIRNKIIKLNYKDGGDLTKLLIDTLYTYEWKLPNEEYIVVVIDIILSYPKLFPLTDKLHSMFKSLQNIDKQPIFILSYCWYLNVLIFFVDLGCIIYRSIDKREYFTLVIRLGGRFRSTLASFPSVLDVSLTKHYNYVQSWMITT